MKHLKAQGKVLSFKGGPYYSFYAMPSSKVINALKPYCTATEGSRLKCTSGHFNVLPVLERDDSRIIRTNRVSTADIESYAAAGIVLVIIPGAVIFVPKPLKVAA